MRIFEGGSSYAVDDTSGGPLGIAPIVFWNAQTTYRAGDIVMSPGGATIRRNTAGTSAATFALDQVNWTILSAAGLALGTDTDGYPALVIG